MGLKGGFVNCSHCFKDMGIQLRELPRSPVVKNPPANAEDLGSIPGLGRYPEGENGNPLQYSCLGNPMDRGACQAYSPTLCLIAESCPTPCDPMDCSPQGSSIYGVSPTKNIGVDCHGLLQGIFPPQGSNPGLPHCRRILYHLSHQGSPNDCLAMSILGHFFSDVSYKEIESDLCYYVISALSKTSLS